MQLGSEKWWMCFSCEGFRASWSPSWKQNLEYIGHIILFGDGLNLKRKTQIWVMNVHLHQLLPLCPHYILPHSIWLVVWNIVYDILGMSSSQLTNISIIFQRGWNSTQPPTSHYTPWSSMIFRSNLFGLSSFSTCPWWSSDFVDDSTAKFWWPSGFSRDVAMENHHFSGKTSKNDHLQMGHVFILKTQRVPSGKRLHNYGKSPCY